MAKFDLRAYARRGAATRASELLEELNAIYAAFPDLRGGTGRRGRRPSQPKAPAGGAAASPRRRRRGMTAAQRKAVGERMRRYWAERRAAAKK